MRLQHLKVWVFVVSRATSRDTACFYLTLRDYISETRGKISKDSTVTCAQGASWGDAHQQLQLNCLELGVPYD